MPDDPSSKGEKQPKPERPTLPIRKRNTLSKRDLVYLLSRHSEVGTSEVKAVLDALELVLTAAVAPGGPGLFTLPGLMKITTQAVPAKPQRVGKDNWSGETREFPAKPATVRVKVKPLQKLKDAAAPP
jgi:hypothetical protein